jgi:hypothetical protein
MNFAACLSNHNVPSICHARANGNPGRRRERVPRSARDWIAAFAGMTITEVSAYTYNVARFTGCNTYFVTDPKNAVPGIHTGLALRSIPLSEPNNRPFGVTREGCQLPTIIVIVKLWTPGDEIVIVPAVAPGECPRPPVLNWGRGSSGGPLFPSGGMTFTTSPGPVMVVVSNPAVGDSLTNSANSPPVRGPGSIVTVMGNPPVGVPTNVTL